MDEVRKELYERVPERIAGLVDLAYNLWWSWHPQARNLFRLLNPQGWRVTNDNPVMMLRITPRYFLEKAAKDPNYLHYYDILMYRWKGYMERRSRWFAEQFPGQQLLTIAYFSAEYGLHHSLPFYSGGLGILAGDHLKECSDLGVPLVGVGFMYGQGYLAQHISPAGWQENICEPIERDNAPVSRVRDEQGKQLIVQVPYFEPPIYVAVWKVDVGKVPLYLLDTNIEENDPWNRPISSRLYTADKEMRLRQEIILGIGGRKVLHTLGIDYYAVHLNEGHPAFALLERIRERVESGEEFDQALEQVRGTSIFTTHTPVPAGHDFFPFELMEKYFGTYYPKLGIDWDAFLALGNPPGNVMDGFVMTALALQASRYHNAVSVINARVAREMWRFLWMDRPLDQVPIDAITNGVHMPTWLAPAMEKVIDKYLSPVFPHWQTGHDNPAIWDFIRDIPASELWYTHLRLKAQMINHIREAKRVTWEKRRDEPVNLAAGGLMLNPDILTIGFARRFASYKRPDLIFYDLERIQSIVNNPWAPVQIVYAGKAHPADEDGKAVLRGIYMHAENPDFGGRVAFIEDYGEQIAHWLVQGVDVWLNNPIPPMEASGTSGMKAGMNGALNLSILDGWWAEGYNGRNGWAFGAEEGTPPEKRDEADAQSLYDVLENQVIPLYYSKELDGIPHAWVDMMKESIRGVAPQFSARRMIKDYVRKYYPALLLGAEACYVPQQSRREVEPSRVPARNVGSER